MIEMEPNEPTNYFGLSKLYEDAGRYDEAEQALLKAKEVKPNDPLVYTTLSGYYNRQGDFDKTIENLEKAAELDAEESSGLPPDRDVLRGEGPQGLPADASRRRRTTR